MYLSKISLNNFKNYQKVQLSFSKKINCFVGFNGSGKTNLLDSIHYLSFCKSFINIIDSQNIKHNESYFTISGNYEKDNHSFEVFCGFQQNQKKVFKYNGKEYQKLSEHIGIIPLVIVSPTDTDLINESSEERRKYFDSVISQFDKIYLDNLVSYNKILLQRNALLKQYSDTGRIDETTLEIINKQLIDNGLKIFFKRNEFIKNFIPIFQNYYNHISEKNETVDITYNSQINNTNFEELLFYSLEKDKTLKYTTVGIHRDDFLFSINEHLIKRYGSQGQQKTYITALKLSQYDYTKTIKGYNPILLLDDIMDKLDLKRVTMLMELINSNNFGQVFITDANPQRIKNLFVNNKENCNFYNISDGDAKITDE